MATYKVLQDIEAEDKLVGPLTLRQCIYAAVAALAGYAAFLAISKGVAFLAIFFVPFVLVGGFFAFPWSRQQPTEVWALAKIRFMLKPRRRVWNQSGIKELVTITAPKHIERYYTNGLSQMEVKSRLKALADTIDSRGWAVKNVGVNVYAAQGDLAADGTDRLVDASAMPKEVPAYDATVDVDMLDLQNNPLARQFDSMMTASENAHRQKIVNQLSQSSPSSQPSSQSQQQPVTADYWFMNQIPDNPTPSSPLILPGVTDLPASVPVAADPTPEEEALAAKLRAENSRQTPTYAHLRTIQPLSVQRQMAARQPQAKATPTQSPQPPVTSLPTPATLDLVNNNDLNVATIAREAHRRNPEPPDEVIVPLH